MSTLFDLAGAPLPKGQPLDGAYLAALLRSESQIARSRMYWHFPGYVGRATPLSAIRDGDFKLIEFFEDGGCYELYNLCDDPSEHHDFAATMPEMASELLTLLHQWQKKTGAALPARKDPNYNPNAERPRGGASGKQWGYPTKMAWRVQSCIRA